MKPTRLPDVGVDGHPLPQIDPSTDVAQLIYLLEYARARGYRVGPTIQVGGLTVQVRDLRQTEGRAGADDPPDEGPWKAAGYDGP